MPVDDKVAAMYQGAEFPSYKTALDDAMDRLSSNKPYHLNRNPGDAERERRELEKLRTEWGFRR